MLVKAMFTLTVFEILPFEGRLVLSPTQGDNIKISVKNQNAPRLLLKLPEK